MKPLSASFTQLAHVRHPLVVDEKWLLGGVVTSSLALFAMTVLMLSSYGASRALEADPREAPPVSRSFDIDAELASLLFSDPVVVDLAANADVGAGDQFAAAKGPPLNLLAQIESRTPIAVVDVASAPTPSGPKLTEEEQLIVAANADRREVRVALMQLQERAESGTTGVATAVVVQPLLRRAEAAAESLDSYADALLLSDGETMKQVAFLGFYASRAAVLRDLEHARAILG